MTRYSSLTRYQSFRWLWRKDPEARWFWLRCWLFTRADLKECVLENLRDFGV
ncbi:hypothetical protein [Pseudoalteromonas phage KB12-38]|nr:hypothetical protein [Pseudoalteromonas phage KB12-38]